MTAKKVHLWVELDESASIQNTLTAKWDAETTKKLILENIYLIENKKALFECVKQLTVLSNPP